MASDFPSGHAHRAQRPQGLPKASRPGSARRLPGRGRACLADSPDDNNNSGGEGSGSDDEEDDYTPPTREEGERAQAKLKRANRESATRRRWLDDHDIDPHTGKARKDDADADGGPALKKTAAKKKEGGKNDDDQKDDTGGFIGEQVYARVKRAEGRAIAHTELRYELPLARSAVEVALARANFNGKSLDRVMKLIDLDEIDLDHGEPIGLDDQMNRSGRTS
ncbi:hypothetical protein [Actinomadura terrae]|uniref:hypothetical protein n=1 Tax=Actinomadura terrae TaxID=604353 RepID=UPI001FA6C755|nr:hypothetical protein [Actinomadura terrae]